MARISEIYKSYSARPTSFIFPLVAFAVYAFVTFFVLLFVYQNVFLVLKSLGLDSTLLIPVVGLLGLVYTYYLCGFKGGMLKGFFTASERRGRFDTPSFITYSLDNARKFFIVYLLQFIINAVIIGGFGYLILKFMGNVALVAVGAIGLIGSLLIINYLLFYAALSIVVFEGIGALKAVLASIRISVREFFILIKPYIFYIVVLATLAIPLVNLLSILLLYPVAMGYAMMSLKDLSHKMARYL